MGKRWTKRVSSTKKHKDEETQGTEIMFGRDILQDVEIEVFGIKTLREVRSTDILALAGKSVTIYCKLNDSSAPHWSMVTPVHRLITEEGTSYDDCCTVFGNFENGEANLVIKAVDISEEGTWKCYNTNNPKGESASLIVLESGPECRSLSGIGPKNEVIEGGTVNLECKAEEKATPPGLLTWIENGDEMSKKGNSPLMYTKKVEREDDETSLNCKLTHSSLSSPLTCPEDIKLNVLYPPKAAVPAEVCVKKDNELRINCSYTPGKPENTDVKWKRADEIDASISNPLEIASIQPGRNNTAILFVCVVSNLYYNNQRGEDSAETKVIVQYDPIVTIPLVQYVREGDDLQMTCEVDSVPITNNVEWIYPTGTITRSKILVINNILRSQWGTYTCRAKNQFCDKIGGTGHGSNATLVDIY
ncbi:cell adhesion molecule 1-like, partial [Ptychodera flava]|uniref:cell adhesion molecule 1-like n=1 Tax=Ptychodera flava TaxID=63121 RepID=UPI00396A575A